MPNHYEILNVAPSSEDIVIRAAYRALIGKYHPDKFNDAVIAEKMARLINEAYAVLSDPARRSAYDASLRHSSSTRPPPPPPPQPAPPRSPRAEAGPNSAPVVDAKYGAGSTGWRHVWLAISAPLILVYLLHSPTSPNDPIVLPVAQDRKEAVVVPAYQPVDGGTIGVTGRNADATAPISPTDPQTFLDSENPSASDLGAVPTRPEGFVDASASVRSAGRPEPEAPSSYPDFSNVSSEDASTVRISCAAERGNGPLAYNRCLRNALGGVAANDYPDLSGINREDASTMRISCAHRRGDGPSAYNSCLRTQLNEVRQNPYPDLNVVDREDQSTIRIACASTRGDGVVAYNGCVRTQLTSVRGE